MPRAARLQLSRLLMLSALVLGCARPEPQSLLLVSLDTTRRDHLTVHDYGRETTPRIAELAAEAAVFESAVAQGPTTNMTHASMFTGVYPHVHGVGSNERRLPEEFATLAEILAAAGFRTAGFVSGFPLRMARTGLNQGFEVWEQRFSRNRRDGALTTDLAIEWLAGVEPDERYFLFVHLYDAHGPYRPPPEYLARFRSAEPGPVIPIQPRYQRLIGEDGEPVRHLNEFVDRYDALIAYQDEQVGRLLDAVDLERTLVVLLADHGETLGERGGRLNLLHGGGVWDEVIRIPFIVRGPGVAAARILEPVGQVDLAPTVLDLLGVPSPAEARFQGESLAPVLRGERAPRMDGIEFASSRSDPERYRDRGYALHALGRIHTARTNRWKLIVYPGVEGEYLELYDLEGDPAESANLVDAHPETAARLRQALEAWLAAVPVEVEGEDIELSSEEIERLRALGYVD